MTQQFAAREVARDYDAIIWIDTTTPSVPLRPAK
jgi:hypothetical protein